MKAIILAIVLQGNVLACNYQQLNETDIDKIADIIYKIEGGAKAKVPYGILSIPVRDKAHARHICKNTIRNNWKRWNNSNKQKCFLNFLGDRYCPPASDKQGNINWKKNIHAFLDK